MECESLKTQNTGNPTVLTRVDLPAPEPPIMASISPGLTAPLRFLRILSFRSLALPHLPSAICHDKLSQHSEMGVCEASQAAVSLRVMADLSAGSSSSRTRSLALESAWRLR